MKKEVISRCPICSNELTITSLNCSHCHIEINGEFSLSRLSSLSKEQINFVEVFLKNQGNIKSIEKDMNISYPTVKKLLNDVIAAMGYDVIDLNDNKQSLQRQEVLNKLASKEINFDEATSMLKNLK